MYLVNRLEYMIWISEKKVDFSYVQFGENLVSF